MWPFDKEKAEEKKYANDEEFEFKVAARGAGLLALWVAEKMGKTSEAAANYADEIVSAMLSDDSLFDRLKADLETAEAHFEADELREKIGEFKQVARMEFEDEFKQGSGGAC